MDIREAILDALVDGAESIIQIQEYLSYLGLSVNRETLFAEMATLLKQGKIYIEYPPEAKGTDELNIADIEDYWFELTPEGRSEWNNIIV